jgi:hypothetical protein
MKQWFKDKPVRMALAALAASVGLYVVGFQWVFVPVLLAALVCYLPFPRFFASRTSRIVASFLVLISLMLVAVVVQFFLFRTSGFRVLAVLITLLSAVLVWYLAEYAPAQQPASSWVDAKDGAALVVVLLFALPVIALTGVFRPGVQGITRFGSVQSSDGANHFMILSEMSEKQHMDFSQSYYPMGLHLGLAFMQDSVHLNQSQHRFGVNARLFVMQYLLLGSILAYVFVYFCRMVLDALDERLSAASSYVLAAAAGLPLVGFFLLPFMYQGFLNYYYVVTVFLAGFMYLYAAYEENKQEGPERRRLFLLGYFALAFGAGMSWPLLVPPLVLVPLLYLAPARLRPRDVPALARRALTRKHWPLIVAFGLQFVPIAMQLRYAVLGTGEQFNAFGSIRTFSFGVILLGFGVMLYASLSRQLPAGLRQFIGAVFQPFYLFMAALMVAQYFLAGELRYYAIKSSLLLEIIILAVVAAGAVAAFARRASGVLERLGMPVLVVGAGALLLIGMSANPLKDVREMFRSYSGFGTPAFFDPDVNQLTGIGSSGDLRDSNVAVLHYNIQEDKLLGNLMPANWVTVMQPHANANTRAQICSAELYTIVMYQEVTPSQQADLKHKVQECIKLARAGHYNYYIVTDNASAPFVRQFFGDYVKVVS